MTSSLFTYVFGLPNPEPRHCFYQQVESDSYMTQQSGFCLHRECTNMEIQVDIEAKPSHYQLVSGSSTEDSLHVHAQMAENEEEGSSAGGSGSSNEEDPPCRHQSCEQKDCLASKPWDISLAQPESIRSDLESSDTQSDDVPDITSDECGSPRSHTAACPSTPRAQGAPSPSAHMNLSAPAEGKTVLKPEGAEARV